MAVTRIYREDLPRVTASRNGLGLSLTKRIRHGLVAKINGKRRQRTCEVLGPISLDYSRARRAPMAITSPRPVRRGEVSERARVFLPFSPPHTCKCIDNNSPYKEASFTSTSKVRLNSCHPPCMNEHLRFIRNY
jgi:hypothetical protein